MDGKITLTRCPRKTRPFDALPLYELLRLTLREFDAESIGGGDGLDIGNEPTLLIVGISRVADMIVFACFSTGR